MVPGLRSGRHQDSSTTEDDSDADTHASLCVARVSPSLQMHTCRAKDIDIDDTTDSEKQASAEYASLTTGHSQDTGATSCLCEELSADIDVPDTGTAGRG